MKIYSSGGNPVIASSDVFPELIQWLSQNSPGRLYIVTDENCFIHCYPLLSAVIGNRYTLIPIVIPAGEQSKSLTVCDFIWNKLTESHADKKDIILNLGGGVVTDTGAFSASVYKRGIRFINMPTSLMAMADAAIGGKCGIDFRNIKNHIGLVSFPEAVFIHFDFLKTLPVAHIQNGYAEIFKAAFIADGELIKILPERISVDVPPEVLIKAIEIKIDITERDPFEKNIRKALNFGHTCGHAIESCMLRRSDHQVYHGDAVVSGMIMEFLLSVEFAGLNQETAFACINRLRIFFETPRILTLNEEEFLGYILQDKKNESGFIKPCLLRDIAHPDWDIIIQEEAFRNVLVQFNNLQQYAG